MHAGHNNRGIHAHVTNTAPHKQPQAAGRQHSLSNLKGCVGQALQAHSQYSQAQPALQVIDSLSGIKKGHRKSRSLGRSKGKKKLSLYMYLCFSSF